MKTVTLGIMTFIAFAAHGCCGSSNSGCKSDSDCKGNRVCVDGTCVDSKPAVAPPQTPPTTQAQTTPPGNNAPTHATATISPPPRNRNGIVRERPSFRAKEVRQLLRGTRVNILGRQGRWYRVSWSLSDGSSGNGWIHADVLTFG